MNFVSMEFWLLTILTILCCNMCKSKKIKYEAEKYCDFSGYTDIAIGVSYLIGIPLDYNFNLLYCAVNPADCDVDYCT